VTIALIDRVGFEVDGLDMFCGYGGSSQGIHRAGVTIRAAVNHKQIAIETHAANFPDVDHWRADLLDPDRGDYIDVRDLPRARFLWASPGCTHHSKANAKKLYEQGRQGAFPGMEEDFDEAAYANSERSRFTMSCVLRYMEHNRPELAIVENVIEVTKWGPNQDGTTFKWWLGTLDKLGYNVQPCWLNSMFFGVPQSRDRVYFVASRKGNPLPDVDYRPPATCTSDTCGGRRVEAVQTWKRRTPAWMLPTWGRYNDQYVYTCPDCRARVHPDVRPASDIIDWSIPAIPIGDRKRPLAPATRARILAGLQRYGWAPVVTAGAGNVYETTPGNRARPLTKPLATQPTTATHALATSPGFLFNTAHGGRVAQLDQPHPTVCAFDDRHHLVVPLRNNGRARPTNEPIPTLCAAGQHHALVVRNNTGGAEMVTPATEPVRTITTTVGAQSLLVPYYGNGTAQTTARPVPTVTTHDRCSLVTADHLDVRDLDAVVDRCHLRMLEADPEIRGASGFAPEYILLGNKKQIVAGLGNAVSPAPAEWLTTRAVATLTGVGA
jgi:DNA (cytosine-5)-methyltransferase 1